MYPVASETTAQIVFWASVACLPVSIGFFVYGFLVRPTSKALFAFVAGGLVATQFCWYFQYLGSSLGQAAGDLPHPLWSSFLPAGLGIAIGLAFISSLFRKEYTGGIF